MGKHEISKEDKHKIALNGRRLAISLLVLIFVVYAFLVFSIAWFSHINVVQAIGMSMRVIGMGTTDFDLYEYDETQNLWLPISELDFSDAVPNETRRYMVKTDSMPVNTLNFALSEQVTANDNAQNENLFDYIYIKNIATSSDVTIDAQNNTAVYPDTLPAFFAYSDTENTDPVATRTFSLDGRTDTAMVFDIYISKNVCNYFELWGFSGKLSLG